VIRVEHWLFGRLVIAVASTRGLPRTLGRVVQSEHAVRHIVVEIQTRTIDAYHRGTGENWNPATLNVSEFEDLRTTQLCIHQLAKLPTRPRQLDFNLDIIITKTKCLLIYGKPTA